MPIGNLWKSPESLASSPICLNAAIFGRACPGHFFGIRNVLWRWGLRKVCEEHFGKARQTGSRHAIFKTCVLSADPGLSIATLVPEHDPLYRHTLEGPDDMPAHIRAALTQTQLSVPVRDARMALGTWQGIYLFEHRRAHQQRAVAAHFLGI